MGRLTIRTEKGAALKLNNPQNEIEARKQLHDKYLIAIEKLAHYEDLEELGRLIEQKHGRWDYTPDHAEYCTVCGFYPDEEENHEYNYCPNCGAKMKLKELEGDKE